MPQHFDKFTTSCQVDRRHHLLKSMSLCSEKNAIGRQQVRPQRILTAAAWPYSEILISALSNQNLALLSIFSAYPILKWTCLCYFFFFTTIAYALIWLKSSSSKALVHIGCIIVFTHAGLHGYAQVFCASLCRHSLWCQFGCTGCTDMTGVCPRTRTVCVQGQSSTRMSY